LNQNITEDSFIFNSFNNSKNYIVDKLEAINKNEFQLYFNSVAPQEITKTIYLNTCGELIKTIKKGSFKKVILSRIRKTEIKQNPFTVFESLNENYNNTFNYIVSIENEGCWIGATPETLVHIENTECKTVSIAGTKSKQINSWGEKEIEEQQLVTDYISKELTSLLTNTRIKGPFTMMAGEVEHLKTEFSGTLNNLDNWRELVERLHPTPATCGIPKNEAKKHIDNIELHDRKFYTGFLGPISPLKKELFVNLRCMEVQNKDAFLYLGGGITSKSIAEDEWNETENKAKTLLKVIGG